VHGGTYTANLVGLSAAHATLDILTHTPALQTIDGVGVNGFKPYWGGFSAKQE
jgi:adenosylmethionine-8-amino-7-oxononanoate aminotransferase